MGRLSLRDIKWLVYAHIASFVFHFCWLYMHDDTSNIHCTGTVLSTYYVFIHLSRLPCDHTSIWIQTFWLWSLFMVEKSLELVDFIIVSKSDFL